MKQNNKNNNKIFEMPLMALKKCDTTRQLADNYEIVLNN